MVTYNPRIVAAGRLQEVALFQEGVAANDAIKLMAEDGDNSALLVRTRVNLFVSMCLVNVSYFCVAELLCRPEAGFQDGFAPILAITRHDILFTRRNRQLYTRNVLQRSMKTSLR